MVWQILGVDGWLVGWFDYYLIGATLFLVVVFVVWVYRSKLRIVYRMEFFRDLGGDAGLVRVGKKEFNPKSKSVNWNKKQYTVKLNKLTWTTGRENILCVNADNRKYIGFQENGVEGDEGINEMVYGNHVFDSFFRGASGLSDLVLIIIGVFVAVAVLCFFVGLFAYPHIFVGVVEESVEGVVGGV